MSLNVYALTCGHLEGEFGRLMEGGEGRIRLPIPAYLIEHPRGTALFDTGMHPDCQHDPAARVGARIAGLFEFDFHPGEEISERLTAIGRDPAKIDLVINSHFHFDHVGGNALVPNATMLVQRREWDAGMDPDSAATRGFNPRDFDLGHKLRLVDGEHDVFGDGSVVCLPTHGHTPGHQSLKLRLAGGDVVLAADSCYFFAPCVSGGCRALPMTRSRCSSRSTGSPRLKRAARASFSATTRHSGKACRRRRTPLRERDQPHASFETACCARLLRMTGFRVCHRNARHPERERSEQSPFETPPQGGGSSGDAARVVQLRAKIET